MKQRVTCNYAVLRFRPYQETGEFVNLGVVLFAHTVQFFDFRVETQRHRRVTDHVMSLLDGRDQRRGAAAGSGP